MTYSKKITALGRPQVSLRKLMAARERLPTSSLDRQRRDIENAAQEIEVRKNVLVKLITFLALHVITMKTCE